MKPFKEITSDLNSRHRVTDENKTERHRHHDTPIATKKKHTPEGDTQVYSTPSIKTNRSYSSCWSAERVVFIL